ncbi:hypothetical protein QCA50_000153 [Cerrena zonata]|uniref:Peptidase A1 domain-containing protein n=1 Tax=Cerrena zonata TaxID=2478898 RepID=A0AAW0GYG7_9APHY
MASECPVVPDCPASVYGFSTQLHKRVVPRAAPSPYGFLNLNGVQYSAVVHVSGHDFLVILDTGSSDLWLDVTGFTLPNVKSSGVNVSLPYGDGSVAIGPVSYGKVTFGNYSIEDQAFANTSGSNATRNGSEQGILGVGLPGLSVIANMMNETKPNAKPFLSNLFQQEKDLPNFISFLLSQGDFIATTDGGVFTIGIYADGYEAIKNAPKLPVIGSRFWTTNVDNIIVNGTSVQNIHRSSTTSRVNDKLTAALDTGSSFLLAPADVVNAVYGNVPGAKFNTSTNAYNVPCDTKLDIKFVFGGQTFPMNPLDLITALDVQNGKPICFGTMNPVPPTNTLPFDFLLGDVFLRNVYSLYYYGNSTREGDVAPYVQLLSVTDENKASSDFETQNKARLDNLVSFIQNATSPQTTPAGPSTVVFPTASVSSSLTQPNGSALVSDVASTIIFSASPSTIFFGTATATKSPVADAVAGALGDDLPGSAGDLNVLMRNSWIIIGLLGSAVLLLLVTFIIMIVRSRRPSGQQYRTLQKAAPHTHGDDNIDEPFTSAYAEQKHSEYTNPYTDKE